MTQQPGRTPNPHAVRQLKWSPRPIVLTGAMQFALVLIGLALVTLFFAPWLGAELSPFPRYVLGTLGIVGKIWLIVQLAKQWSEPPAPNRSAADVAP